jgi:hypothetical protein
MVIVCAAILRGPFIGEPRRIFLSCIERPDDYVDLD